MSSSTSNLTATGSGSTGRLSALSAQPDALFTYGTLIFPEVLQALLGRVPLSVEASVQGWRVVAIPGVNYPALVPGSGLAQGRVLLGLRPEEWEILDAYEDVIYELRAVATTPAGQTAFAYVCLTSDLVSDADWDKEQFAEEQLPDFAPLCARWRQRAFP